MIEEFRIFGNKWLMVDTETLVRHVFIKEETEPGMQGGPDGVVPGILKARMNLLFAYKRVTLELADLKARVALLEQTKVAVEAPKVLTIKRGPGRPRKVPNGN